MNYEDLLPRPEVRAHYAKICKEIENEVRPHVHDILIPNLLKGYLSENRVPPVPMEYHHYPIYIYTHMYTHIQTGGYRILYLMFTHIWWDNKYSSFFSLSCSGKRFRRTVALLWGDGNSPCPCCDAGSHHWGIFVDAQVGHIGWCGPHARRFFGLFANSVSREHATSTINLGSLCWTQRDAYFWIRVNCKTV